MDLSFTPKEEEFRKELAVWLGKNLPKGWLEGTMITREDESEKEKFLRDWQNKLYQGNWAGIFWPKEYGGRGATVKEELIFQQEMAQVKAPEVLNIIGIEMVGPTLMQIGTEEQKKRYLPKILNGEEIWCQGYSEPNAGSDLASLQTWAEKKGDKWFITGQKVWTSFAHLSDYCFLLARTKKTNKKHEGITAFLLDMHQEGVETRPISQMNEGKNFNEVFLNDAVAHDEDIVGEIGEGWKVGLLLLSHERSGLSKSIFKLQHSFTELMELSMKITKNGRPAIENPLVKQRLIVYYTRTKACLYNYYRHFTMRQEQKHSGAEGALDKIGYSELLKEMQSFAISLHGPANILWKEDSLYDSKWQHNYLSSFSSTMVGGTSEILRNIVGERMLGLPKDEKK